MKTITFTRKTKAVPVKRTRLSFVDTLATASLGPRSKPSRTFLSSLGVAIGITSLVAVMGIPACLQAEAQAEFDKWGANLLIVSPSKDRNTGEETPLPKTAPAMVDRIWPVKSTLTLRFVEQANAYRTDKIPERQSSGISVAVADGDPLETLTTTMASGRWFDQASTHLPTVILGSHAATLLGADVGQRVWVGHSWWAVIGVLEPLPGFLSHLNSTVFLAPQWADQYWPELPIDQILVNAHPGQIKAVQSVAAATANPAQPSGVNVQSASQFGYLQDYLFDLFAILAAGVGAISLLIGGILIANTMIVSVMERRGEIGVRRALGARSGQIGLQFVLEAALIGLFGGILGVSFGVYIVFCFAAYFSITFAMPIWLLGTAAGLAIIVGVLAGLYPSLKAARQSPMVTLRVN